MLFGLVLAEKRGLVRAGFGRKNEDWCGLVSAEKKNNGLLGVVGLLEGIKCFCLNNFDNFKPCLNFIY